MSPHPLAEAIADLFLRPGHAPAREGADHAHRARIRFEWVSGQWVLLAPENRFQGWMSWYRVSADVFDLLKREDIAALVARDAPGTDLTQGPCLYIATAVVAPGAPGGTYRRLFRAACQANPGANIVGGWLRKQDERRFWHERPLSRPPIH